jgi:hypothetical protein
MTTQRWPDHPLVPEPWTDDSPFHVEVVSALSEGACPKHLLPLAGHDGWCPRSGAYWELVSAASTIPVLYADRILGGPGVYPGWAQTDGRVVQVTREPNWGCELAQSSHVAPSV